MDADPTRSFAFHAPGRIVFGLGVSSQVGDELAPMGVTKALVVTDPGLRQTDIPGRVTGSLDKASIGWTIFSEVEPNPCCETVEKAFAQYQAEGCNGLVAVGGGSSMDVAKAVGILANSGGSIVDYEGVGKVKRALPPLVAIPTTCGTGSEVTQFTVITDSRRKFKMGIGSAYNIPRVAVIDPTLLVKLPAPLVASTGMDALTHAVEGYTNLNPNPISDAMHLKAINMIGRSLRKAVANGNLVSLSDMAAAAAIAGMAFGNSRLGIVHAMSHTVSGHAGVPHGVANAILLPHCMEYNLVGLPERHAEVAEAMGEDTEGLSIMDAAWLSVEAVRELSRDVGIPSGLREVGVTEDMLDQMADDSLKSGNIPLNPRRVTKVDMLGIFSNAMG